jgi:hypothetical protein
MVRYYFCRSKYQSVTIVLNAINHVTVLYGHRIDDKVLPISVFTTGVMVVFARVSNDYGDKADRLYIIQTGELCSEIWKKEISSASKGNVGEMSRLKMTACGPLESSCRTYRAPQGSSGQHSRSPSWWKCFLCTRDF